MKYYRVNKSSSYNQRKRLVGAHFRLTPDMWAPHFLHGFLQNIEGLGAGNYTWNFDKKKWELIEEKE
ncbi:MAG: hypothetical protein AAFU33_28035 [Bacteroidota bacterium]